MSIVGNLLLIPIVAFYLLLDWPRLMTSLDAAVPRDWHRATLDLLREVDALMSQFFRGQLLLMATLALFYSIGLSIVRLDLAIPIGLLTGLLIFIPYVGYAMGLGFALLAAVLQFGSIGGALGVAVVYGLGQVIESFFLTPRLVGERIGLHPVAVIFALLAFGELFGFVGVLVALPCAAILLVGLRRIASLYYASPIYLGSAAAMDSSLRSNPSIAAIEPQDGRPPQGVTESSRDSQGESRP